MMHQAPSEVMLCSQKPTAISSETWFMASASFGKCGYIGNAKQPVWISHSRTLLQKCIGRYGGFGQIQ